MCSAMQYFMCSLFTSIILRLCFSTVFSVTLYEKLNELGEKKQSLIDEMEKENRGTPAEERERLLKQVNPVTDGHIISHFHCHFQNAVAGL